MAERTGDMATYNEDVTVNGMLQVSRPWTDWLFLRQERDVEGGGGFHIHNPWGNSTAPQGSPDRNRLEIGYRTAAGQDLFGLLVIHGPTGNVGIGTETPQTRFEVGNGGARINGVVMGTEMPGQSWLYQPTAYETVGAADVSFNLRLKSPNEIIFHTGSPACTARHHITKTGTWEPVGHDCAEYFQVEDKTVIEPGTVMVIGDDGQLEACAQPYDKRVAGVVSGGGDLRPGIILGHDEQEVGVPLALIGKTYCKVDARDAPVAIGDLLTTGEEPGHAMRATDRDRAFGAVLGKALQPLETDAKLIPVLVGLQ
jgi:hypothetical protein